jgi:putative transposase
MAQSLARLLIHIIFSTKHREPCFADLTIRKDLHAYLAATSNHLGCPSMRVGGVAGHVHVVCALNRALSVATLVAKLKVSSNQVLKEKSLSQFSWQNGFAAFLPSRRPRSLRAKGILGVLLPRSGTPVEIV